MRKLRQLFAFFAISVAVVSCSKENIQPLETYESANVNYSALKAGAAFPETFESGSKTSYTAAAVALSTGSWYLNDALIGTTSSDPKIGTKSARIRNTGKVSMQFDVTTGATSVTIKHAKYGTDANSTWELWMSTNSGSTYTKTGSTVTSSATALQTQTFTISIQGNVRFEVRKISGGTNRINIDDFSIVPYGSSGGGGGGTDGDHIAMGNPSGATADIANANNYLMVKVQYKLSYNRSRATANWVSWYLGPQWVGTAARQDDFRTDVTLPTGWYRVGSTSYSGSGFDRGHNCPSADRTSTVADNSATFLMTNMIPQAPVNNQQTWANLEDYGRTLVGQGNEVYIIMGCYGTGGSGSNGFASTINNGNVTVPSNVWKVLVILPLGTGDVNRVGTTTRIIAVNTPNINTTSTWGTYRCSIDAIEAATGYDLLSSIPVSIQSTIEAKVDSGPTN